MCNNIYALKWKYMHTIHTTDSQCLQFFHLSIEWLEYPLHRWILTRAKVQWIESTDGQIPLKIDGFHEFMNLCNHDPDHHQNSFASVCLHTYKNHNVLSITFFWLSCNPTNQQANTTGNSLHGRVGNNSDNNVNAMALTALISISSIFTLKQEQ